MMYCASDRVIAHDPAHTQVSLPIRNCRGTTGELVGLLNHAALLYEGIRTYIRAKKAFEELPYYQKNEDKIRVLSSEFGDARSFSNRVLKKIRDKIAFHFDKDLITLILRDYLADSSRSNSDIVLVTGKSELVKDMAFPFADKLIITHVLRSIEGEGQSDEEKFRILAERLLNLSNIFCTLIDDLIPDLVGEYCELRQDEDQT